MKGPMEGSTGVRLRRAFVVLLVMVSLVLVVGAPANAAGPSGLIICNATGTVVVVPGPPGPFADQWTVAAKGTCVDTAGSTFVADVSGVGTSDSLGTCDRSLYVGNLHLNMTITLTGLVTTVLTESWEGPVTTYPVATPFIDEDGGIQSDNDVVGAGVIFSHIAAKCPPLGTPAANIFWARTI